MGNAEVLTGFRVDGGEEGELDLRNDGLIVGALDRVVGMVVLVEIVGLLVDRVGKVVIVRLFEEAKMVVGEVVGNINAFMVAP